MDLNQLRYFQVVARTGNLTHAARQLYVTQPNLSKSITKLEKELGVPLFDHRKGRIELNDYGRIFLSSVDIAFAQLSTGAQTIQRMYESDQHILPLASNIYSYLPDILPAFCAAHPDIGIRQMDCTTQQMIARLLDRSVALGISNELIEHEQLEFHLLGHKKYVLAVHLDHPFAAAGAVRIPHLERESFICDYSRMGLETLRRLCQKYGFSPAVEFEVQSSELLFQLVEANRGIAILPVGLGCTIMHQHPGHHLRLVRIDDTEMPEVIIGIVHHRSYQYTKAAELFQAYLCQRLLEEEALIRRMGYESMM